MNADFPAGKRTGCRHFLKINDQVHDTSLREILYNYIKFAVYI